MKELKFRNARANEIEVRVGATNESGFSLLLYKTARVDANILDETVGPFNWQKKFYQVKNTMICSVGINMNYDNENAEPYWVWKDDAGDESNTEAIKGEASDSFKRAGFAWNICRSLYSAPFIWVKKDQENDPKKSHYEVKEIEYTNNEISKLVIVNEKNGQVVFTMGRSQKVSQTSEKVEKNTNELISEEDRVWIIDYVGGLDEKAYSNFFVWLQNSCGTKEIGKLTKAQGGKVVSILKNRKA